MINVWIFASKPWSVRQKASQNYIMPRDRFHHAGSGTIIMSRFSALLPLWDICNDWQFWQKSYFSKAASLATFQRSATKLSPGSVRPVVKLGFFLGSRCCSFCKHHELRCSPSCLWLQAGQLWQGARYFLQHLQHGGGLLLQNQHPGPRCWLFLQSL